VTYVARFFLFQTKKLHLTKERNSYSSTDRKEPHMAKKSSQKKRKKKKKQSTGQRKILKAITLIFGVGAITFLTPVFGVLDNATGGAMTKIWNTIPVIEKKLSNNTDNPSPPPRTYDNNNFDPLPAYQQGDAMVVRHKHYALRYNEQHEQAEWVAYKLEAEHLKGNNERNDHFRSDPAVPSETPTRNDYRGSGYDRGHLAPAADFRFSKEAIDESFYMSNMSPQEPGFNRGMWRGLESKVRDWAKDKHQLYIVAGPVLEPRLKKIGRDNKVSVPKAFYKIILDLDPEHPHAIAFLMPNKKCEGYYEDYMITIDALESKTGIDFFPLLPDDLEDYLEQMQTTESWFNTPEAVPAPN